MTSYTNTFTGAPIQVTPTSFREFSIGSNTTLSWPQNNDDNSNVVADTMEVTASAASLSLTMPPANEVSSGKATLIRNVGANTFSVKDAGGGAIQSIAAGEVFWVYVTDNSTEAGSWSAFQFGTGTSSANAADLDGNGLTAIGSLLNVAFPVNDFNSTFTLTSNYRATIANWTGGAGTFNFDASATLGNNWFIVIKNSGSGALTLDPNSTELIDGVSSITLNVGESCIVACTGTALLSFCKNSVSAITFTRLVKSVAGSSNVTLSSGEAGYDIQEYTGLLTGNISVIVPTAVSRWWVFNNTTGAFSLTVKTAAGTGIAVAQGTRQILHCDGTNVVLSVDAGTGTVTNVATGTGLAGGPITTTGTISLANTAVAAGSYGSSTSIPSFTVDAQGRLTTAAGNALDADLVAIAALAGTSGILCKTAANTWALRTLTAGTGILIQNPSGVAGNPVFDLDSTDRVLKRSYTQDGAYSSLGSVNIPYDNTKPQITEGSQILSLSFTPIDSTSKLSIKVKVNASSGSNPSILIVALFSGGTDAIATTAEVAATDSPTQYVINHSMTSGTTSPITFTVRIGSATTQPVHFNGGAGVGYFNGTFDSSIEIVEYGN